MRIFQTLSLFTILSLITGVFYPTLVTLFGIAFFSTQVNGSLVEVNGNPVGSTLVAQAFKQDKYFWPRPSAVDFATVPSGASNLGPTSAALFEAIEKRQMVFGKDAPADLLLASGSGLDPHISIESALYQAERVAKARSINIERVKSLVFESTLAEENPILGQRRLVNVLKINLSLDGARTQ